MDRWVTYRQRLSAVNPPHQLNTVLVGVFNHSALLKWSCLSFAWDMKGCRFSCNALRFGREWRGGRGVCLFLLLKGFSSEVALLVDPNPLCSCEWGWVQVVGRRRGGGVILDSHRFSLLYRVSSELLTTEKRFASLDHPSSPYRTSETFTARPPLMLVGKTVNSVFKGPFDVDFIISWCPCRLWTSRMSLT